METKIITMGAIHINDGQLEGLPKNPRFIRDEKYKKLVQSIQDDPEMLELRELLVYDSHNDVLQYIIIGGNMRYRAMKELGYKEAPCKIIPFGFPMDKMRRILLKDNSSFGETNFDLLINEWTPEEIDMSAIDIPDIEDPQVEEQAKEDDFDIKANTPKEAKSKLGDIYQLGEHRLMCGDSTEERYIEALMEGERADILITDPPYNVDYEGGTGLKIQNDNMEDSEFLTFLYNAFKNANASLKEGGAFYIWHADSEGFNFRTAAKQVGWQIRQCLIWVKNSLVMGRQDYQWKHEPCLYGWKDGAAHYFVDKRNLTTTIECDRPNKSLEHPTMKPIPLIGQQIQNSSKEGDIVLDIFGGSGTTLIACEQLKRRCRMVEFDPIYVDVIIKRWEDLTGEKAQFLINIEETT